MVTARGEPVCEFSLSEQIGDHFTGQGNGNREGLGAVITPTPEHSGAHLGEFLERVFGLVANFITDIQLVNSLSHHCHEVIGS